MTATPQTAFDALAGPAISAVDNPEEAVAATAAFLREDRRADMPTIDPAPETHVTLEQGLLVDGEWVREAEVRELSGDDEEALARCGESFGKLLDTLVVRGTRTVGGQPMSRKIADQLLIGDRETLILAVRKATFGPTVDFDNLPCPHCDERMDLRYALADVPTRHLEDPDQTEFAVPLRHGATAYVRLPNGADQNAVQALPGKPTDAEANTVMLGRCVLRMEDADGKGPSAGGVSPKKLSMPDRQTLMKFLIETQPGPRFNEASFVHDSCGREVPMPLPLAVLFRGV